MSRIDEEALAWVAKLSAGSPSESDRCLFEAWYASSPRHQGAYLRAQAIWHSLDRTTIQTDMRPVARVANPSVRLTNRRYFLVGGIVSAVAACAVAAVLGPRVGGRTVLKTGMGEFRKVPLADRTVASLNSGSHVEVSMTPRLRRVVLLEGEAWFEVAKNPDQPFVVEAGDVRVRAIGTAFSVRRRGNGADVLVTEGVVEAWSDNGTAERSQIAAGEEAFIAHDAAVIHVADAPDEVERKLAWRDGNIILNNETLVDAVAEFNRYNAQKIIIADPAIANTRFVGQYRIDQPERFADAVHSLLNVPTSTSHDGIVIGAVSKITDAGPTA